MNGDHVAWSDRELKAHRSAFRRLRTTSRPLVGAVFVVAIAASTGCSQSRDNSDATAASSNAPSVAPAPDGAEEVVDTSVSVVDNSVAPTLEDEVQLTVPADAAALGPADPPRTGGLEVLAPDVQAAVAAAQAGSSELKCESLMTATAAHPITLPELLTDDGAADTQLLQLLSELQLAVSQATTACASSDPAAAAVPIRTVNAIASLIQQRDAELRE